MFEETEEILENSLFDETEIADPIDEQLPHRGTPYYQQVNPLQSFLNPPVLQPVGTNSNVDDKELEVMADLEADFLFILLKISLSITRGVLMSTIYTDDDKDRLRELRELNETNSPEAMELLERFKMLESLAKNEDIDDKTQRDFLKKVVTIDFHRKRREGKLKFDGSYVYLMRMFVGGVMSMLGRDINVLSTVGRRIVKMITKK